MLECGGVHEGQGAGWTGGHGQRWGGLLEVSWPSVSQWWATETGPMEAMATVCCHTGPRPWRVTTSGLSLLFRPRSMGEQTGKC